MWLLHISKTSFSETKEDTLVKNRVPRRLVKAFSSESPHEGCSKGFMELMQNVEEGVVNDVIYSDVICLFFGNDGQGQANRG